MQYEVQIPADGTGNHPSFMMVTEAKKALAEIGMDIVVSDLSDATALWDSIPGPSGRNVVRRLERHCGS